MKWAVVVPWRAGDRWRERNVKYVTRYLADNVTSNWSLADSDGDVFSRSQAKNHGARRAISEGFDVVVFHDADMIIPIGAYLEAVERAVDHGGLTVAFAEYRALDRPTSQKVCEGRLDPWDAPAAGTLNAWSLGGIIAVRLDQFAELGGYDERFRGWGCEDTAFAIGIATVSGLPTARIGNPAVHLWHPHGHVNANAKNMQFNGALLHRYSQIHNLDELREVQTTP